MVHSFRLLVPPLSQLTAEFGFFRAGEYGVGALQKAEAMFLMVVVFLWYGCQKAFVKGRHPLQWVVLWGILRDLQWGPLYLSLSWAINLLSVDFL